MNVLSLFSGVGGLCTLGLGAAGMDVVGLCEIDAKARSVLRRHEPDTPIWTDVTAIDTKEVTDAVGRIDLVCGGSPCQDLSVAGRRAGLDGQRSGLFWHQCRIADELAAPWIVWENVAGAFSSNDGADFAAVLWGLTGTLPDVPDGGWRTCGVVVGPKRTAVWRLLDAQWFGVAQRRRRVFVVAGPRAECGPEVLALAEGVSGHPRPSRTPGPGVAALTDGGAGTHRGVMPTTVPALTTRCGNTQDDQQSSQLIAFDSTWFGRYPISDADLSPTVKVGSSVGAPSPPAVAFSENQRGEVIEHDVAHSLKVGGGKPGQGYPAVALTMRGRDGHPEVELGEPGSSRQNGLLTPDLAVRRLTPRECERLMGWPDDHTRWADDGNEIADSHRYRMCGNGVVAPVAEWIGERILEVAA